MDTDKYISELNPTTASEIVGTHNFAIQESDGQAGTTRRIEISELVSWIQSNTNYTEIYNLPITEDENGTYILLGSGSPNEQVINITQPNGKVGVKTTTPTATFEIYSSDTENGDLMITPESGDKMGVHVISSDNDASPVSGAILYLGRKIQGEDANFVGLFSLDEIGNTELNISDTTATTTVNGYAKLGDGSNTPEIKMIKLTGTTPSSSGSSTSLAHGLADYNKIISCNVLIKNTANNSWIPPNTADTVISGSNYSIRIGTTNVYIILGSGEESPDLSSINIENSDIVCTIMYEK